MLMPIDVAPRPQDVGPIAALMLGGGFTLTAAAPLALGFARDATGSFTLSMWLLLAVTAITLAIVRRTSQPGLRRRPLAQTTADGSNCGMISLP
jgi:cyanate permease